MTNVHRLEIMERKEYETVSYNLPLHLIDLYRDLATERHRIDQANKRELRRQIKAARRAGMAPPMEAPPQARQSASAVVREAMEAYADTVRCELEGTPLNKLPKALTDAGYGRKSYAALYAAGLDGRIPVHQAKNSRWFWKPSDLEEIAIGMKLTTPTDQGETT